MQAKKLVVGYTIITGTLASAFRGMIHMHVSQ